jgi:hypothetical protein
MNGEPGAAVLSIFSQLTDRIKQRVPVNKDGKPIGTMVYSHLVLGMPISKADYFRPWTPAGGATLRDKPPAPKPLPDGTLPAPEADERFMQAMQAAWKTAILCRTMLQVSKDEAYHEYPTGRHLDFAYETVLAGMQPNAEPEMAADVKARVDKATRLLYVLDDEGAIVSKTPLYLNYVANSRALAKARSDFAAAAALAQRDPAKAEAFPVQSATFQQTVDECRDALMAEGADRVEQALDVIGSVGKPMQAHMIRKAREVFDAWNLNLSGVVPSKMPYSLILPTNWCDAGDPEGFERLTVDQAEIHSFSATNATSSSAQAWQRHASSSSGGGAISFGFLAFGGSHAESSTDGSFQNSSGAQFSNVFSNSAKNLHIELEYGLCTIVRPWLVSDIFFLKNWFLKGAKKHSVSVGNIDGQADSMEKTLPMIPQQFLVVRNVRITASDWGSDGQLLSSFYGENAGSDHASSSSTGGAAGVCLGFLNFGGTASHDSSDASGQGSSFAGSSMQQNFGAHFANNTLSIPGAQIVAFLSDIVPAAPDLDDPTLA